MLSLEVLLAATAFSMTAALVWSLVWNGLNRYNDAKNRLETVNFLKNRLYDTNFYKSPKDSQIFKYENSIHPKDLKVERFDIPVKSSLAEQKDFVRRFEFKETEFGTHDDPDAQTLVAFFPYFSED